jgi:uncharacterized Zn-binding protein involved in type VI secretion
VLGSLFTFFFGRGSAGGGGGGGGGGGTGLVSSGGKSVAHSIFTSSHGGTITPGSSPVTINGHRVARSGDLLACPVHGSQAITATAGGAKVGGIALVRAGDTAACGAVIQAP